MLFPLPLVAFEEYMLREDRPSHPMNFFGFLRFTGRLDRDAVAAATATIIARHPLLAALVRATPRGRFEWVAAATPANVVRWCDEAPAETPPQVDPIDIQREPGLRIWIRQGVHQSDVLFQFYHACCDGLSGLAVIDDWVVAYALTAGAGTSATALRPLEQERLRARGRYGLTVGKFLKALPRQLIGLLGARQFLARRPTALASSTTPRPETPLRPSTYPSACFRQLPEAELKALHVLAKRREVTLNDLFVRDWFLALGAWKSQHYPCGATDWLRLTVPINVRTAADRKLPAANVASMVFLDRQVPDFADHEQLLQGIHDEMGLIKRNRLGLTCLLGMALARCLPGGLARHTEITDRPLATTVLTNLGATGQRTPLPRRNGCLVVGPETVLLSAVGLAPFRPHTHASLCLMLYAGQLQVGLNYDAQAMTGLQAEGLLDAFVERLRATLAGV